jgi:hypothetical protein
VLLTCGFAQGLAAMRWPSWPEYELARTWSGGAGLVPRRRFDGLAWGCLPWSSARRRAGRRARRRSLAAAALRSGAAHGGRPALVDCSGNTARGKNFSGYKAACFWFRSKTSAAEHPAALTHIVRAFGGDQTGTEELRAALRPNAAGTRRSSAPG